MWSYIDHYVVFTLLFTISLLLALSSETIMLSIFFFFYWTLLSGTMMLLCQWVLGISFLRKLKWLFYWWTQQPETVIVPSKHLAIGYENFWNNMKVLIRVMKTWGRFMLGYQNLKAYETWLPKLLSKFSNPFCLGTQDY